MGTFTSLRRSSTMSKILSVVTPPVRARKFAAWITGPSAVGSENGMPSSIRSAPFFSIALTISFVVSRSGSPQVINGINALPPAKASLILLMDILPSVAGDGCTVFIASSGNIDDHDLIFAHGRSQFFRISYRMGTFDSRNNALGLA